jgi:hypothetical protein
MTAPSQSAKDMPRDLTGVRFTMLTVLSPTPRQAGDARGTYWLCQCDCGAQIRVTRESLVRGYRKTCGCSSLKIRHRTHGKSKTPTYAIWNLMMRRCHRPAHEQEARYYHDKGIRVCERWHDFASFYADMGERPAGLTLERIDNTGNYEPGNCRWATTIEQGRNKSNSRLVTYQGKTQCVSAWAEETGIKEITLWFRINKGWPLERALTKPATKGGWPR